MDRCVICKTILDSVHGGIVLCADCTEGILWASKKAKRESLDKNIPCKCVAGKDDPCPGLESHTMCKHNLLAQPAIEIPQCRPGDRDMKFKFTDGTNPRSDADAATPIMMGIEKPLASVVFPRCEICGSCAWTPRDDWKGYWECCGCKGLKKLAGLYPMTHGLRPPGAGCNGDDCLSLPGNGHPLKSEECDTVTKLEKPLPCAFCGVQPTERFIEIAGMKFGRVVRCSNSECFVSTVSIPARIKQWNQREKLPYCPKCNCSWFYTCSSTGFRECRHCNTQYAVGDRKEKT